MTLIVVQIASFVAISYMEERWRSVTIVTLIVVQMGRRNIAQVADTALITNLT